MLPIAGAWAKTDHLKLKAEGYDSHVDLQWQAVKGATAYQIFAREEGQKEFTLRAKTADLHYLDFVTDLGRNIALDYKVTPVVNGHALASSAVAHAAIHDFSDDQLVNMVQQYTFRYFWDYADAKTGLAWERNSDPKDAAIAIGGSGFGVMTIVVAAEHGWITREQAVARLTKITHFLKNAERYHGMWSHWYYASNGKTKAFSKYDDGGDLVESAFMAEGLLTVRQYFNKNNKSETALRNTITDLWEGMDWQWYTNGQKGLTWHWSKKYGFKMNFVIHGYNECLIAYILAESSPTHPITKAGYNTVWAGRNSVTHRNGNIYYGMSLPLGNKEHMGGPLFFAHYSYQGLDPRGLRDQYANYWEQNRRHTLINRAYCIDNPRGYAGYGENLWGLTASDLVPNGYGASAPNRDYGVIAPTAALSSMPYAPAESMKVLKNLYRNFGKDTFGKYGFYDAVKPALRGTSTPWVRKNYLAIDQGPIVNMMENYRSGLLWNNFMKNKEILKGLQKLGFTRHGKTIAVQ
ncbi:hypothetical protein PEPS_29380 (plasmid) [Persicobacter psychrovividus]|uniref:Glycoamylase-like domain-containing protein n=2 Tax=Persicobacter psychrovividus TaxID=387638 RepID=A0ABN6LG07_9BACT|nr:hypothetical protein PEPS_29380 [Persicobacter psychrovividus]